MLSVRSIRRASVAPAAELRTANRAPSVTAVVLLGAALLCGCRAVERRSWETEDVAPKRLERKEEVLAQFELQRDAAQFAAATSRFEMGDLKGCRETLESLLKRNPQHAQGQQLLAKVQQSESDDAGPVASARWDDQEGTTSRVASVSAALPIVDISAPQTEKSTGLPPTTRPTDTYVTATDFARASCSTGPPQFSDDQKRLPIYRSDTSDYHGGACTDVARRSVYLAIEALAAGDEDGAAAYYRAAAAAEPRNVDLRLAAAAMLIRYEQYEQALELALSAQSLHPGDPAPYRSLGTIHYRRGDYRAAYASLSRAISLDKAHPLSYFLMGSTLRKLGEIDKAGWHFRKASELDSRFATQR